MYPHSASLPKWNLTYKQDSFDQIDACKMVTTVNISLSEYMETLYIALPPYGFASQQPCHMCGTTNFQM